MAGAEETFWIDSAPGSAKRYKQLRIVGYGAYGIVASAIDGRTEQKVAIKRISDAFRQREEAVNVLREIRLLSECEHPNVVGLKTIIPPDNLLTYDTVFVVLEYMETDLRRLLRSLGRRLSGSLKLRVRSKKLLSAGAACSYASQMLAGLRHVHALGAIHRDLKPDNVLLSPMCVSPAAPHGTVRLGDFGLARTDPSSYMRRPTLRGDGLTTPTTDSALRSKPVLTRQMTERVVTRFYRAPEVILRVPYSSKIDIWAAGCIFKELLEVSAPSAEGESSLQSSSEYRPSPGVLFPGESCSAFSPFANISHVCGEEGGSLDQLGTILATLGTPTLSEFAHLPPDACDSVQQRCPGGAWSKLSDAKRSEDIRRRLSSLMPTASMLELALLEHMLAINPEKRASAASALLSDYFATLPDVQKPIAAPVPSASLIASAFSFESEDLSIDEMRELLADDIHRFAMLEGETLAECVPTTGSETVSYPGHHHLNDSQGMWEAALAKCMQCLPWADETCEYPRCAERGCAGLPGVEGPLKARIVQFWQDELRTRQDRMSAVPFYQDQQWGKNERWSA